MKPAGAVLSGRGKLPSAGSLLVGILVGLLVASVSLPLVLSLQLGESTKLICV